jgi:hypothetical protein
MSFGIRLLPDTLRTAAFGAIGAGYTAIGTPFGHAMRIISIKNLTDANLLFSFDGVNDHEIVPTDAGIVWDFCTNRVSTAGAFISVGTTLYVKQSGVPTSGAVYVSCFYGFGE